MYSEKLKQEVRRLYPDRRDLIRMAETDLKGLKAMIKADPYIMLSHLQQCRTWVDFQALLKDRQEKKDLYELCKHEINEFDDSEYDLYIKDITETAMALIIDYHDVMSEVNKLSFSDRCFERLSKAFKDFILTKAPSFKHGCLPHICVGDRSALVQLYGFIPSFKPLKEEIDHFHYLVKEEIRLLDKK